MTALAVTETARPGAQAVGADGGRSPLLCAKCGCDAKSMIDTVRDTPSARAYYCNVCSHEWSGPPGPVGHLVERDRATVPRQPVLPVVDVHDFY